VTRSIHWAMVREVVSVVLAFLGLIFALHLCTGCSSPQERVANAIVVATYDRDLDHCKELGKTSGSFAVYETCAKAVDRRLCAEFAMRCEDGGGP